MRKSRTGSAHLTAVAIAISGGMFLLQSADAQAPGSRAGQHAASVAAFRHIQARIAGIDPTNNRLTLRDRGGEMVTFEISPDIADVKTLQIGDMVNIAYRNAILARIDIVASSGIRERMETEVMQPASNGEVSSTRSVELVATVLKIDRKKREVTLRGPIQTQEFDVSPTLSLDRLKVGDTVRVEFISAVAASVDRVGTPPQ
jgi:Cu/Ag efflux protein CusF